MKAIENDTDYREVITQEKPILLDFYADWCGPCQTLMPTIEKLSKEYNDTVEIRKINVDNNKELSAHFQVRSIPALFFIKDSKIVEKLAGLRTESELRTKLDALLD